MRIGNLTLQELYAALDIAEAQRQPSDQRRVQAQISLPEVFTYFDCTDYVDEDETGKKRPLLTFAKWRKRNDPDAKLRWYSHRHLLFAYIAYRQKPKVRGGDFEGELSQQLIYRLACLGFDETTKAYDGEAELGKKCEEKQIRVLLSPCLRGSRSGPAAAQIRRT